MVKEFARRTGDLGVLSRVDLGVLALAYEIECERNGGDWRLRKVPGQKGLNGSPPKREGVVDGGKVDGVESELVDLETIGAGATDGEDIESASVLPEESSVDAALEKVSETDNLSDSLAGTHITGKTNTHITEETNTHIAEETNIADGQEDDTTTTTAPQDTDDKPDPVSDSDSDSDSEGWITPSNIAKHKLADSTPSSSTSTSTPPKTLQVATLTTDFAMQNVLLLMNLNLLSPSLTRIQHLRTYILRCHACFLQLKDLSKQFCTRCGQPALTRVSCSTDTRTGEFKLHLKKNMQWNTRGDRFSIPKPVAGTASGKRVQGGGKGGWGNDLILAEDQREYVRAVVGQGRRKERDLMDDDFLPGLLSGERRREGGRPKVGAGRTVNSRKR